MCRRATVQDGASVNHIWRQIQPSLDRLAPRSVAFVRYGRDSACLARSYRWIHASAAVGGSGWRAGGVARAARTLVPRSVRPARIPVMVGLARAARSACADNGSARLRCVSSCACASWYGSSPVPVMTACVRRAPGGHTAEMVTLLRALDVTSDASPYRRRFSFAVAKTDTTSRKRVAAAKVGAAAGSCSAPARTRVRRHACRTHNR